MKICKNCKKEFASTAIIDGKIKSLTSRSYCLTCSPFKSHKGYELRKKDALRRCTYSVNKFKKIIKDSFSISQALKKLGLVAAGGNYFTVKKRIQELDLDISHFTGQSHLKGKKMTWGVKIPLKEILVENSTYSSSVRLKKRLLESNMFEYKCYCCKRKTWLNKPIPLELEHKNGNKFDNRKENLTLLCPNCHSFTPYYRGKNINKQNYKQKTQ